MGNQTISGCLILWCVDVVDDTEEGDEDGVDDGNADVKTHGNIDDDGENGDQKVKKNKN